MAAPRGALGIVAGAAAWVEPGCRSFGAVARGMADARRSPCGGGMYGGGGAAVATSPCGTLLTDGLVSDDSAGGCSLPRFGGWPVRVDGADEAVCAGGGAADGVAGVAEVAGAACGDGAGGVAGEVVGGAFGPV